MSDDPFAVLGVPPRADLSDDDVRAAWRRLAAATHPDRADGGEPARFAAAAAAYTVLRTRSGRGEALADLTASTPPPRRTPPAGQAPPLAGSEIVIAKGFHRLSMIPLEGLAGPIKIKSQDWNLNMAPMGAALPDADLAAVLTYLRNSWGNKAGEVTADDIKAIRAQLKSPTAIAGDKLMSIPE